MKRFQTLQIPSFVYLGSPIVGRVTATARGTITVKRDNGEANESIAEKYTSRPIYELTQLLESRVAELELNRGGRVRVQREIVKFISLPFPFSG